MRKIIITALVAFIFFNAHSQNSSGKSKMDYQIKSKDQRIAGWALLGGGAGIIVTGLVWNSNDKSTDRIFADNFDAQAILVLVGSVAMVASIPVFVAAAHHKKKAEQMSMNFHFEKNDAMRIAAGKKNMPSLTLRIPLGR